MTKDQESKISQLINDIIEYRFDSIRTDNFKKRKVEYFSIEIDTPIPMSGKNNTFGFSFGNQKIYFSVGEDGHINLYRDDYMGFIDTDKEFTSKYIKILKEVHNKKQSQIIDDIVTSAYSDLKLLRESNIGKLMD